MVNRRSLEGEVPEDIYRAQVDAMYCDFRSLWIGAFAASLMTLCVSVESAKLGFAIIAFGLTMVGLLRCFVMSIYIIARQPSFEARTRSGDGRFHMSPGRPCMSACWALPA